jgi:hypothetical protein
MSQHVRTCVATTRMLVLLACCVGIARPDALSAAEPDWVWRNPLPQGHDLYAVWGSGSSDVFAVGQAGTILHYDGSTWSPMDSGTTADLHGVWGTASNDVYAFGDSGTFLRYNGTSWQLKTSGTTRAFGTAAGVAANEIYVQVCSGFPTVFRYNGSSWGDLSPPVGREGLAGLCCTGVGDVYTVGGGGRVLLRAGSSGWSSIGPDTSSDLNGVWADTAGDVTVVGFGGTIIQRHNSLWSTKTSGTSNSLRAVWRDYAVGDGGTIVHCPFFLSCAVMYSSTQEDLLAVWGSSQTDVFAVGRNGAIVHYDGTAWTAESPGRAGHLYDVWGSGPNNVYGVGETGLVMDYDGASWDSTVFSSQYDFHAIWGSGPTYLSVCGGGGKMMRYDAGSWQWIDSDTTNALNGLDGSGIANIYAVGQTGTIVRDDGTSWAAATSPTSENLNDVAFDGTRAEFAVGDNGTILRMGRNAWYAATSPTSANLRGVAWLQNGDALAVGDGGTVLFFNGNQWSQWNSGTSEDLFGVWGGGSKNAFIVGDNGTILHYDGEGLTPSESGTVRQLRAVWGDGTGTGDVYAVGLNGTILSFPRWHVNVSIPRPDLGYVYLMYGTGHQVRLHAGRRTDGGFSKWQGQAVPTGKETDNPLYLTLTQDVSITALFVEMYKLFVGVSGQGRCDPNAGTYSTPVTITLTAKADPNWQFDHWEGDLPPADEKTNPLNLLVDQDRTLMAVFVESSDGSLNPDSSPACCAAQGGLALPLVGVMLAAMRMRRRRNRGAAG